MYIIRKLYRFKLNLKEKYISFKEPNSLKRFIKYNSKELAR